MSSEWRSSCDPWNIAERVEVPSPLCGLRACTDSRVCSSRRGCVNECTQYCLYVAAAAKEETKGSLFVFDLLLRLLLPMPAHGQG